MGQIISVTPRLQYPNEKWEDGYNNRVTEVLEDEVLIEYTAHPDAAFHLLNGRVIPLKTISEGVRQSYIEGVSRVVTQATQTVTLKAIEKGSRKPVAVKLHVHGGSGEYLAPKDRHRIPNPSWFEDFSVDFIHLGTHHCTYIPGETRITLPLGQVYIEVSKGFEIRPGR